uniref:Carcinustatin-5 n=1 Tax=Carcinus maenas TaxID=6759 RepID=ALL5_CARMA|nr:RecName: Full=Carcinustatin-5 [Carcinus maenas]
NPYAFGL